MRLIRIVTENKLSVKMCLIFYNSNILLQFSFLLYKQPGLFVLIGEMLAFSINANFSEFKRYSRWTQNQKVGKWEGCKWLY